MKQTAYIIFGGIVVLVIILIWTARSGGPVAATPTPLISSPVVVSPTKTPVAARKTSAPTPRLIAGDVQSHQQLVDILDPLNRRIALDASCTSSIPSQVAYPNDIEIMIDNYKSNVSRILTLGGREYSIDAHSWIITKLHSDSLPAKLSMFCGLMELGQIDLLAK